MNIRDLKYLIAVAKYESFGQASKACFVSQPALSMQIKKLEDELGVILFERTNKNVMITLVGEKILERALEVVRIEDEIKNISKDFQNPFAGNLKLGVFPTLAPYYLPKIIPVITNSFTDLTLLLTEEKTSILVSKLKSGEIDCAFLAAPINEKEFEMCEIFKDEFLLAVPKNHSLASFKEVNNKQLQGECLLLLKDGHCLREQALDVCSLTGSCVRQDFQATSLETLRQMVAAGVGATLIPKIAVRKNENICYLPFKAPAPVRTICMVWRKSSVRRECILQILNAIKPLMAS